MTTYTWSNAHGGIWSTAGNWTPNGVPGAGDLAVIDLDGGYVVTLDAPEIGSLTLDAAGARLVPAGTLRLDGTLDVRSGTLTVAHTIQGGTLITNDGGTIAYAGGILDGVTLSGPLDLGAAGSRLTIADGIGSTGASQGQILDTGTGSGLTFSGSQTLHDIAVTVGRGASLAVGTLTLDADSSLTANQASLSYGDLDNEGTVSLTNTVLSNGSTSTIENEGTLSLNSDKFGSNGLVSLTNTGTVNFSGAAAGGSSVFVDKLTNSGVMAISQGAHVTVTSDLAASGFSNTGAISIDATSTLELSFGNYTLTGLGNIANHGGTVLIDGTLDLGGATVDITAGNPAVSGFQLHGATLQNGTIRTDGTGIHYAGNFNTLSNVTIDGTLNVNGGANSKLAIDSNSGFAAGAPVRIVETTAGSYLEFDGSRTLDDADLTLGGSSFYVVGPQGPYGSGTLTLGSGSVVTLTEGGEFFGPPLNAPNSPNGVLDNKGTIVAAAGGLETGAISANIGPLVENEGVFTDSGGSVSSLFDLANSGMLSVSGAGSSIIAQRFDNTGTVAIANGGSLTIRAPEISYISPGQFDSTGTVQISSGGTLTLQSGAAALGTISFLDGTGTLVLFTGGEYSHYGHGPVDGTLNLFQSGDVLDLGPAYDDLLHHSPGEYSIAHSGNTLTVDQGTTLLDSFALTGRDYTDATFTLTGDTVILAGNAAATDAPCFCAGTRILTDQGERAVEDLAVGDLAVTRQDGIETVMPVRWVGRRRVVVAQHAEPEHVDPIRIARDAMGPGLPARDLFVSPDHALHLDGMLVQARQLVNHMTVTRDSGRAVVTYYHVELDRHAILIADGLPCESYLDGGNRHQFDAAGIVVSLHHPTIDRVQAACAPVVIEAAIVQPVWQRLAERALAAGHVASTPQVEAGPAPWLETVDGVRLSCLDGQRFALPPGCRELRLRSCSDRPTTLAPWSDDRRRLGVAVSALRLHHGAVCRDLDLSGLEEDAGWWPRECAGDLAWRWTNGDGRIVLPEAAGTIEIVLHAIMPLQVTALQAAVG